MAVEMHLSRTYKRDLVDPPLVITWKVGLSPASATLTSNR
jgi:hypothetical protein